MLQTPGGATVDMVKSPEQPWEQRTAVLHGEHTEQTAEEQPGQLLHRRGSWSPNIGPDSHQELGPLDCGVTVRGTRITPPNALPCSLQSTGFCPRTEHSELSEEERADGSDGDWVRHASDTHARLCLLPSL